MSGAISFIRRFLRDSRAASAAELALVLPIFLILVFGTINAGLAMSAMNQIHYAAERSARCLSVDVGGNCTSAAIDTFAKTMYNGPAVSGLTFVATQPACGNQVVGSGSYEVLTGFDFLAFNISAQACYPVI